MNGYLQSEKMPNLHGDTLGGAWEESDPVLVLMRWGQTMVARCEVWDEEEQVVEWYTCDSEHFRIDSSDIVLWYTIPEWRKV